MRSSPHSTRFRAVVVFSLLLGTGATAPVVLDGVTLLPVRGVTSLPAAERARRIADRVAADPPVPPDPDRRVERR